MCFNEIVLATSFKNRPIGSENRRLAIGLVQVEAVEVVKLWKYFYMFILSDSVVSIPASWEIVPQISYILFPLEVHVS